jgi:hypothetical protein
MPITAQILNDAALQQLNAGGADKLAKVSATFIADRLWDKDAPKPEVQCELSMAADNIQWIFHIKMNASAEKKTVYVNITKGDLLAEENPITYVLENAVKNCLFPERREDWKTPIG